MGELVPSASESELEVLKALWDQGAASVRELHSRLKGKSRKWAHNTVLTLLTRLREKGYVASDKAGTSLIFRAVISRNEMLQHRMTELADQVCDGEASPLVHALVKSNNLTAADIADLRKLLDQLEQE